MLIKLSYIQLTFMENNLRHRARHRHCGGAALLGWRAAEHRGCICSSINLLSLVSSILLLLSSSGYRLVVMLLYEDASWALRKDMGPATPVAR